MKSEYASDLDMKQMDNKDDLEQLRRQVSELKEQLNNSRITTRSIIRKAMKSRSSWLDSFVKAEVIVTPVISIILGLISFLFGSSLWPVVVFLILGTLSTWIDWHTFRIAANSILTMPMSQLKDSLIRQKRHRLIQTMVETPLSIGWLCWYFISIKNSISTNEKEAEELFYGAIAGGCIAALIVVVIIYSKAQKTNNELIQTIESEK